MTMPSLDAITNDDPVDATPVQGNFAKIAAYVDGSLLNKDGAIAVVPTADLTLGRAPSSDLHAATKKYVDDSVATSAPTASVTAYAGATAPTGYLLCDGAAVSLTTYSELYAIIGVTYGNPGGGNFNLPNLKDQFPVGKGTTGPHNVLGETGGSANTTLVSHTHPVTGTVSGTTNLAHGHSNGTATGTTNITHGHADTFATASDGIHAHSYPTRNTTSAGTDSVQGAAATGTITNQATFAAAGHTHGITGSVTNLGTSNKSLASGVSTITALGTTNQALSSGTLNSGAASASTTPTGGSASNTNLPPYLTLNYIIKT